MLNIGRMAPGSVDYYLGQVAELERDATDYYLARGEAPGRWLGRSLELFDLDGQVSAEPLRRLLDGRDPSSGQMLAAHPARKVPGFDLTFRAPKSVSLTWALTDDRQVADQVVAAHEAAVEAAMGYLDREAFGTRRGAGGVERCEIDGVVVAAFRHRTSRAGDPLLHTHVLVPNLVPTSDDGVWRTLESRRIYQHAKTAGVLYQAQLRHELTRRLGVASTEVTNGVADIDGIDREVIEAFSTRRRQILDRLEERGESSAKAAQVATLETRQAKGVQPNEVELRATWTEQAAQLGLTPDKVTELLGRHVPETPDVEGLARQLLVDEELTARSATFGQRDLLQAIAERLPDGATVEDVEALAGQVIAHGRAQVVALGPKRGHLSQVTSIRRADGRIVAEGDEEPRMTTVGLLTTEHGALTRARQRTGDEVAVVPDRVLQRALAARPTLTDEQRSMVTRLTGDGDGVAVVLGRAGTGKTFALDAARDAWAAAGIQVQGVALAARAARELQDSSGIASMTIARLLGQIDRGPGSPLEPGSVLVVDEAGMVDTRTLARLIDHTTQQDVKLVLVGDPRQLPEIEAGGLFGHLCQQLDPIELTVNRRQREPWEIGALDQLRHGDPAAALRAYGEHGRLVQADTAEALREQLVSDWWDAFDGLEADSSVMVALRQVDVDDLNDRARGRLYAAGQLGRRFVMADGRELTEGERIVCLRNDRRLGVDNGTFATITHITDAGDLHIRPDHAPDQTLTLPRWYSKAGHVTHGYAITGHKAQGLTVDHTFVLGSDALYREWGYVALSRGRTTNKLYVHPAATDPHGIAHGHQPEPDPLDQTRTGLGRSRAQVPASAYTDDDHVRQLGARWRQLATQVIPVARQRQELAERRGLLDGQRAHHQTALARLESEREQLTGPGRLRAGAREQRRALDQRLERQRHAHDQVLSQLEQVDQQLAGLPDTSGLHEEYKKLNATIWELARSAAAAAAHHPPSHLLANIGAHPQDSKGRATWRSAALAVESYRICWDIDDPDLPLGHPAHEPVQREQRARAMRNLLAHQRHLRTLEPELEVDPPQRSRSIGLSR